MSALRWFLFALAAGLMGLARAARSQPYGPPPGQNPPEMPPAVWVLSKLHEVNQLEIRLGRLAVDRAEDPLVRDFGRRLVDDHRRSDRELTELAQRRGFALGFPRPRDDFERRAADDTRASSQELEETRGRRFDRLFARAMYQAHDEVIRMLEHSLDQIHDREIRHFAERALEMLREYRSMAEGLRRSLGEDGGRPGVPPPPVQP